MLLSVLIPALQFRNWKLLYNELIKQSQKYPNVEILVELDNGQLTSGIKRQMLMDRAIGTYVVYVDDDDSVADDYISKLLYGCQSGRDVVTFHSQVVSHYRDGKTSVELWELGVTDNRKQMVMSTNHVCAWKKSIASQVAWCPNVGYGDDQLWYKPLNASGLIKTRYHIRNVLYYYHYDYRKTANQTPLKAFQAHRYAGDGLRCYWWILKGTRQIVIEVGGQDRSSDKRSIVVRDRRNTVRRIPFIQLQLFYIAVIV